MGLKSRIPEGQRRQRNARGTGDRLRIDIINAATEILARLGENEPFSLRAVAKEAKIAPPSVYLHFPDKTVLLLAVLEELFKEMITARDEAEKKITASGGGAWEMLLARAKAHIDYGLENTGHYKVLYEGRAIPRLADPRMAKFGLPLMKRAIDLILQVSKENSIDRTPEEAERLALLLWAGLHGIVSLRINKPTMEWPDLHGLAEQLTRILILQK